MVAKFLPKDTILSLKIIYKSVLGYIISSSSVLFKEATYISIQISETWSEYS